MKIILLLVSFIFSFPAIGQKHNRAMCNYAYKQLGKKVGSGKCSDLVNYAYKSVSGYKPVKKISKNHWQVNYGNKVHKDSIMKGDIVLFVFYDTLSGKELGSHVGIVYEVKANQVTILNQNYHVESLKKSKVVLSYYNEFIDPDPAIRQTVEYFRPY